MLRRVARQAWLVVLCAGVGGGLGYWLETRRDDRYEARVQILVQATADPARARATALQLATIPEVARRVAARLGPASTRGTAVTASAAGDSDVIVITARAPSAKLAADLANAFATESIAFRRATSAARYEQAADVISDKVDRLKRKALLRRQGKLKTPKKSADRHAQHRSNLERLRAQIDRLHLRAASQTGGAQIVQRATVPAAPLPDHRWRNALIGALGGLLLGLVVVVVRQRLRDRLDREDDLATVAPGVPVLGYIPAGRSRRSTGRVADGFHNLAAALQSSGPEGGPRTVLVTSAMSQEGKSSTALNLALDLAQREANPLYVEADLRRPALAGLAALDGATDGVRAVLAGTRTVEQTMTTVPFAPTRGRSGSPRLALGGALNVVPAGEGKAEPQTLIGDRSAAALLSRARERAGYVIVDGPPLGVVADVLPIAKRAEAVLVVVRLGHTRTRRLRRLLDQLANAQVQPAGIVVIGADTGEYYR